MMKYLRLFEAYIAGDKTQVEYDINDMLVEVEDYGYGTNIVNNSSSFLKQLHVEYYNLVRITATSKLTSSESGLIIIPIKFNDVKDCLLRIKDYLGDRYLECIIRRIAYMYVDKSDGGYPGGLSELKLGEDSNVDYPIYSIEIRYR